MIRKLCDVNDLPAEGTLKAFVDTRPDSHLALCVGVLGGAPYAIDNMCPHQRAPLAAGHLEGEYVVCPIHAWKFRLTDGLPQLAGDPALPTFEVRQYGTEVFVRVPGPRSANCSAHKQPGNEAKPHCALLPFSAIR